METLSIKRPLRPSLATKLKAPAQSKPDPAIAKRAGDWLVSAYPGLFKIPPVPLPIGFRLMAAKQRPEGVSHCGLNRALYRWVNSKAYLRALAAAGAMRHDVNGQPIEPVAEEHRQIAALQLQRRLGANPVQKEAA